MSTLGFATIVTQIALAWQSVTGGGIGIVGPEFPAPFNTAWGYLLSLHRVRRLLHLDERQRRSQPVRPRLDRGPRREVAAEATGISKPRMLIAIFLFAGRVGGDRRRIVRELADPTSRPTHSPSICRFCSSLRS